MKVKSNKIADIRRFYKQKLLDLYSENEADSLLFMLFSDFANLNKSDVVLYPDKTISEPELLKIDFAVKDLLNNKPIQYILGKTEFYDLTFEVGPDVLIPRPETEELVDLIIKENKPAGKIKILDIGTGSGCIAISLKKHIREAEITAIDISAAALSVAKKNAKNNNVEISFRQIDILDERARDKLSDFDIIVSNPPYVRKLEKEQMKKNVLDYEPDIALFVEDDDPFLFYRAIAAFSRGHLTKNGKVYCEINQYIGEETAAVFIAAGFNEVEIIEDINGNARILLAKTDSENLIEVRF